MDLTPSSKSAALAGAGFWVLIWSIVFKIDVVLKLFKLELGLREKILDFVRKEKGFSLMITEGINFGIHGFTNPVAVTFALGGTVVNAIMVMIGIPLWCKARRKS